MDFIRRIFKKKEAEFSIDKNWLKTVLPADARILEAGVADGIDTEEFANIFPSGRIYGFECLPFYVENTTRKLEKYSNVTIYPYALSNVNGVLDFHVSKVNDEYFGSGSILKPELHKTIHPHVRFDSTISVQSITIDDWVVKYRIDRLDFLWLDLQGAELKVLGAAETILQGVKGIFTEVSLLETYQGVPLYSEVKEFLTNRGFRVEKEFLPYKDMGNVLFQKG